jgi:hypothetical protein
MMLAIAVRGGNYYIVQQLLAQNPNYMYGDVLTCTSGDGKIVQICPLYCAFREARMNMVQEFLQTVQDWDKKVSGKSILSVAVSRHSERNDGYESVIRLLLSKVSIDDRQAADILRWSLQRGDSAFDITSSVITRNPESLQLLDYELRFMLAQENASQTVEFVMNRIDPNRRIGEPIIVLAAMRNQQACKILMENSDLKMDDNCFATVFYNLLCGGPTCIAKEDAAKRANFEAFLRKYSQRVCNKDSNGKILLKEVIEKEPADKIALCLDEIDPNTKLDGVPLISIAVNREVWHDPTWKYRWVQYEHPDESGRARIGRSLIPLEIGSAPIVSLFIKRKANLNAVDSNGNTPLHFAILARSSILSWESQHHVLTLLLNGGADQNIENKNRQTPLHLAILNKNFLNPYLRDSILDKCLETSSKPSAKNLHKCLKLPSIDDQMRSKIQKILERNASKLFAKEK